MLARLSSPLMDTTGQTVAMSDARFSPVFGHKIRSARKARKLSQGQLAEAAGCSQGMISMLERGSADPSLDLLERICDVLGLAPDVDVYDPANAERIYRGPMVVVEVAREMERLSTQRRHLVARLVAALEYLPIGHLQVLDQLLTSWERSKPARPPRPGDHA
jgi:transcriptional regulator with XRE-family HTH domain